MTHDYRDRLELMQRLNNRPPTVQEYEDAEQMAALEKWRIDHPNGDYTGYIMLIVVGIPAISLYAYSRHNSRQLITLNMTPCHRCHAPEVPVIKNGAQYGRIHSGKTIAKDQAAIEELKRQEWIIKQFMGAK